MPNLIAIILALDHSSFIVMALLITFHTGYIELLIKQIEVMDTMKVFIVALGIEFIDGIGILSSKEIKITFTTTDQKLQPRVGEQI